MDAHPKKLTPEQDEIARAIIAGEKRKAHARRILNRPASSLAMSLALWCVVSGVIFLQATYQFDAPKWVIGALMACLVFSVANAIDLWETRRRLDAAIFLLQEQTVSTH